MSSVYKMIYLFKSIVMYCQKHIESGVSKQILLTNMMPYSEMYVLAI